MEPILDPKRDPKTNKKLVKNWAPKMNPKMERKVLHTGPFEPLKTSILHGMSFDFRGFGEAKQPAKKRTKNELNTFKHGSQNRATQ